MQSQTNRFEIENTTEYLSASLAPLSATYAQKHISAATLVDTMSKIEGYQTAYYGDTYMKTPDNYAWFCVVQYIRKETTISVFFPWTNVDTKAIKSEPPVKIYFSPESATPDLDNLIEEMTAQIRDV